MQCILKLNNKEQKGKGDKRFALNRKVLSDILYKIKLDDAAVAMGISTRELMPLSTLELFYLLTS